MTGRKLVCLSANPALDRQLRLPSLVAGEVNRAESSLALPGGKAAHVAMAVRALGAEAVWIGFLGGPIGDAVGAELSKLAIEVIPIRTKDETRVNLEMIEDSGRITEVLEPGGCIEADEQAEMMRQCAQGLRDKWKGAMVAISGSLPRGISAGFYATITNLAHAAGSRVFLDTSGDALRAALEAKPDFVKPNRKEAEALLGRPVNDSRAAVDVARELINLGARSAAVTLGVEGLVWFEGENGPCWIARPPRMNAISTVGCGDATLAGFAYSALLGYSGEKALRLAVACGAANCQAEFEGRISPDDVQSIIPRTELQRVAL